MKITVSNWYNVSMYPHFCCWAKTTYEGEELNGCGATYAEAEQRVVEKVKAMQNAEAPPPEHEIEV